MKHSDPSSESLHKERRRSIEDVPIRGGTPEQRALVADICRKSFLPLERVKKIRITKNGLFEKVFYDDSPDAVGSYDTKTQTIILSEKEISNGEKFMVEGVVIHELAHANSPFKKTSFSHGDREKRLRIGNEIMAIAEAFIEAAETTDWTHKDLRNYNKLRKMLDVFKLINTSKKQLYEETWALLVQSRYAVPGSLRYIQDSLNELNEKKIITLKKPLQVLSNKNSKEPQGVDTALLALMPPEVTDIEGLRKVFTQFRS